MTDAYLISQYRNTYAALLIDSGVIYLCQERNLFATFRPIQQKIAARLTDGALNGKFAGRTIANLKVPPLYGESDWWCINEK